MRVRFTPLGVNPQTNDNYLLRNNPADCYIIRTRHASEGWHPGARQRTHPTLRRHGRQRTW